MKISLLLYKYKYHSDIYFYTSRYLFLIIYFPIKNFCTDFCIDLFEVYVNFNNIIRT